MKFIPNGPDIPEELLQAHEDGRVVFFCGAGISCKVGLGNFKWLVDEIYENCNTVKELAEKAAYKDELYDTVLNFLENRLPGGRQSMRMRKTLVQILQPNMNSADAKDTHLALFQLARHREGNLRLVTTNFDRAFKEVAKIENIKHRAYSAPMLPIPKVSQWNGLVYLHGILPKKMSDKEALDRLVVTSGDFGLAYLAERWAARFVSELFRNFIVCFVGYSINDPVIRYMTDAIAADRVRGESTNKFYVFVSDSNNGNQLAEWKARDIIPILYDPTNDHELLHETIKKWSEYYRDGIGGKERIVAECAGVKYAESTKQDNLIANTLWAISDKSGLPAKKFANTNPVPSLMWLDVFSKRNFHAENLIRFGIHTAPDADETKLFSLICRPAPYELAPNMELVSSRDTSCELDDVMKNLAHWLVRHINDPALLQWIVRNGGRLHKYLANLIEQKLIKFESLQREGKTNELKKIRANSPNAIPDKFMKKLWRLLLNGQVIGDHEFSREFYDWRNRLTRDGLTTSVRVELRRLLAPRIKLRPTLTRFDNESSSREPERISDIMSWQLVLFTDRARKSLNKIKKEIIEEDSSRLLNEFQQLLLDALGLIQELEGVDGHSYLSHIDLPSIAPHWQNDRCFSDWVVLIELLRDTWLEIRRIDPCRASQIAQGWFEFPYPSFKRLALFAASQDDCIPPKLWVEWIVDDNARLLWSEHTRRETMRLMVTQASNLTQESVQTIEAAILKGPSRGNYLANLSPEQSDEIVRSSIRLRLSKLAYSEKILSDSARSILQCRLTNESDWQNLRDNERNEFVIWRSGTGAPDFEESRIFHRAPSGKNELVKWLKEMSLHRSSFHEDDWQEICRSSFEDCISALSILSSEEQWPVDRWSQALYAWSSEDCENCSWQSVLEVLHRIPIEKLEKIAHSVAFWADSTSQSVDTYDADFLNLCKRILTATYEDKGVAEDPVASAINHPIGLVTSALLNIWFNQNPGDNEPLPTEIETILTNICDTKTPCQRYGRVMLASRLVPLFRADSVWAKEKLLPKLDWSDDQNEALAAWCGLLWSPRLYPPLLVEIKQHFLTTAKYYSSLGKWKHRYSELLTHVGLAHVADYSEQDLQEALKNLNEDGLPTVARTLYQALDNSESQREEYWNNRIKPFLQKIWPQSNEFASKEIAEEFAAIAIAADSKFVEALGVAFDWLEPLELPDRVILILKESEIHKQFPKESLCLLNAIISEQSQNVFGLREVLDRIVEASSSLSNEPKYVRLEQICRRYGY